MTDKLKNEKRIPCQIFSRIVGYVRPLGSWNDAKQHEFHERQVYDVPHLENKKKESE